MHATLIALKVFIALLVLVTADQTVDAQSLAETGPDCTDNYNKLCSGCNDVVFCLGDKEPEKIVSCTDPSAPYCLEGQCSANPPSLECVAANPSPVSDVCTGAGYFPHPTDCHKFTLCADAGGEYAEYECPKRYVYNADAEECRFQWWSFDCKVVTCPANSAVDEYVPFPGSSGLFAMCVSGVPMVFRCQDTTNFVYDDQQKQCVLKCRSTGRVADPADSAAYYECSRAGLQLTSRHWKCVTGYTFNALQQKCVRGEVKNC